MANPSWWSDKHEGAWDRVKHAMKRDWEQTKADWSKAGHELDQGVGDTVKQMAGKEAIPPADVPNPKEAWETVEPAMRYGTGARVQYGDEYGKWDDRLEAKLADEWKRVESSRPWAQVKARVQRAFDRTAPKDHK